MQLTDDVTRPSRARDCPKFPIMARGFLVYLAQRDTRPANVPTDRFWPGQCSPFRRFLTDNGYRVTRMTDYTVNWSAGAGRASTIHFRMRLPIWCMKFHQALRAEGARSVSPARCIEIMRVVAPHAFAGGPIAQDSGPLF